MQRAAISTSLTITEPLVLYKSLIATHRIQPDGAQYRLAAHLQKNLYPKLKDYEPEVRYQDRLRQLSSALERQSLLVRPERDVSGTGFLSSIQEKRDRKESLALVRRMTDREEAMTINSPKGLLLHGDVGTGKSMLIDLLANSLPTQKKRRWHFNAFMLELFAMLDGMCVRHRQASVDEEHHLLRVARDLIRDSPNIYLDEFQLPDRAAAKILTSLFTSFFQLGGVLVATSNRMPEELSKAIGTDFALPVNSSPRTASSLSAPHAKSESDFPAFLNIIRSRCDVWRLEGLKDWRRFATAEGETIAISDDRDTTKQLNAKFGSQSLEDSSETYRLDESLPAYYQLQSSHGATAWSNDQLWMDAVRNALATSPDPLDATPVDMLPWTSRTVLVYGRQVHVPRTLDKVAFWEFRQLCGGNFGPADYISLAATFHTFVVTDVPVLTSLHRNEARRFITLLDALYEARCKLLIRAEANPDSIFFPDIHGSGSQLSNRSGDEIHSETLSEIYQDQTSPFRPNVVAYGASASTPSYESSPLPRMVAAESTLSRRSILADEDSDFGPLYPTPPASKTNLNEPLDHFGPRSSIHAPAEQLTFDGSGPNFQRVAAFNGEDEHFAYKRAVSRLWEMCSEKWWNRTEAGWWTPVRAELRRWERPRQEQSGGPSAISRHIAAADATTTSSPFRTSTEPPPKFSWVHAWGLVNWGRKARRRGEGPDQKSEKDASNP